MTWTHTSNNDFTIQCDTCGSEHKIEARSSYAGKYEASKAGWAIVEDEDGKTHTCPACCKARELAGRRQDATKGKAA